MHPTEPAKSLSRIRRPFIYDRRIVDKRWLAELSIVHSSRKVVEIFKAAIEPITRDVYKESRSGLW
ncbi:MAG TPA: hypothetical protein VFI70_01760 [Nitrososphaeraceae archaeon]|nr:hypothetical protein [Nitrososphaeraceae archaeon]